MVDRMMQFFTCDPLQGSIMVVDVGDSLNAVSYATVLVVLKSHSDIPSISDVFRPQSCFLFVHKPFAGGDLISLPARGEGEGRTFACRRRPALAATWWPVGEVLPAISVAMATA